MSTDRDLGIALSGGGHRATVFGLGAVLALADLGLNRRTVSISSVSGGSIANGIVMVGPDFGTAEASMVGAHVAPRLAGIADRGILLGGAPATRNYLRALIAVLVLALVAWIVAFVGLVAHWWMLGIVALVLGVLLGAVAWWLVGQRSIRTERAIDDELLGGTRTNLRSMRDQPSTVHHVICTTDLQTGTSLFFTNRVGYGHRICATTEPLDVPLSAAVQASACVPGAFAPRVFDVTGGTVARTAVVDGGVYDNMADEWEYGFANRRRNWPQLATAQPQCARTLIVVNASAGWDAVKPVPFRGRGLELAGLLRSKDVQYDVSTAHRRRALAREFLTEDDSTGLDTGVFVQITASPYMIPMAFGAKPGREPDALSVRAAEARDFLDRNGYDPQWWIDTVKANAGVPTTLAKLGRESTARLTEHGYVLTLVNLYVILGLGGLPASFDRSRFDRLAAGSAT